MPPRLVYMQPIATPFAAMTTAATAAAIVSSRCGGTFCDAEGWSSVHLVRGAVEAAITGALCKPHTGNACGDGKARTKSPLVVVKRDS
jgi:hypothetical protein